MGVNGVGGGANRFQTFNFNELMNGKAGRQVPRKADPSANGVVFLSMAESPLYSKQRISATYGKAFLEETRRRQEEKRTSTAGKKDPDYNHKKFSRKMKDAKNAQSMQSVLADIRATIADLKAKQATGEYDEDAIAEAILHAELMEAAAMKRTENLEQEEMAERKVKREELEELLEGEEKSDEQAPAVAASEDPAALREEQEIEEQLDAEMKAMQEEMQRIQQEMAEQMEAEMEEMMAEMSEEDPLQALDDMAKVLGASVTEEDVEEMKKKHRAAEDMATARADMEYLKFRFNRLQRERDALKSGAAGPGGHGTGSPAQSSSAAGFADGAKIVAGAVKSAQISTAFRASSSAAVSAPASGDFSAPAPGASIDVSG